MVVKVPERHKVIRVASRYDNFNLIRIALFVCLPVDVDIPQTRDRLLDQWKKLNSFQFYITNRISNSLDNEGRSRPS